MIDDESGEKVVSMGFRAAGKFTAETLKKLFDLIIKKGGLAVLTKTGELAKSAMNKVLDMYGFNQPVEESQLDGFNDYAKKYNFKFSVVKDKNHPGHYALVFHAKDVSKFDMAMQDFMKDKTIDRGLREKIEKAKEHAYRVNKAREPTKEHTKSHAKDVGKEL